MKPRAETSGQRKGPPICHQRDDVVDAINNGSAMPAVRKMQFQHFTHCRWDCIVEVIGYLSPNFFAGHRHGFLPFLKGWRLSTTLSFSTGASKSLNCSLARSKRVFTTASLSPMNSAVAATLFPLTSCKTNT